MSFEAAKERMAREREVGVFHSRIALRAKTLSSLPWILLKNMLCSPELVHQGLTENRSDEAIKRLLTGLPKSQIR